MGRKSESGAYRQGASPSAGPRTARLLPHARTRGGGWLRHWMQPISGHPPPRPSADTGEEPSAAEGDAPRLNGSEVRIGRIQTGGVPLRRAADGPAPPPRADARGRLAPPLDAANQRPPSPASVRGHGGGAVRGGGGRAPSEWVGSQNRAHTDRGRPPPPGRGRPGSSPTRGRAGEAGSATGCSQSAATLPRVRP